MINLDIIITCTMLHYLPTMFFYDILKYLNIMDIIIMMVRNYSDISVQICLLRLLILWFPNNIWRKRLFTKIHFCGNKNHIFFVFDRNGLSMEPGFWWEKAMLY